MSPEVDGEERTIGALLAGRDLDPAPRDWERLTRRAIDERLGPLLFWTLRGDRRLPERKRNVLRRELYRAEAWNLVLYRSLETLLEAALEAGLDPPVILKGGALATSLYDEIGLRPMSDLDLLVPRSELARWLRLAGDQGFRRLSPEMSPGLTEAVHYQVALAGGATGDAMIEIHFGLVGGPSDWRSPELRWFFDRAESWEAAPAICSRPARQLHPTAHLLYLAAHAMLQHGGAQARLIWFYDIHLLVSRASHHIRWGELGDAAREFRWDAALARALSRARDVFGTTLPDGEIERLEGGADAKALRYVERKDSAPPRRAELVWSELSSVSRRDRLRWALGILFPRPAYMRWRYPKAGRLWPVLYPYRWARVAWEGARALRARPRC